VAAGAITAIALLTGAAVSAWHAIRATTAEGVADERWQMAQTKSQLAIKAQYDAKRQLFEARLAQARAGRGNGQAGQRLESLKAIVGAAELARELGLEVNRLLELRNEAIASVALADVKRIKEWDGPPSDTSSVAFDADLELYARSDRRANISIRRVSDDQEQYLLRGPSDAGDNSGAAGMEFSPDGNLLAVRYYPVNDVRVWDLRREELAFPRRFRIDGGAMRFSPDGRRLALGQSDGTITIHDATTGDEVGAPIMAGVQPMGLNFSPDGERLAISSWHGRQVLVLDLSSRAVVQRFPTNAGVWGAAWHSDGDLLAFGCEDSNLYIYNTAVGQQHAILRGHQAAPIVLAFAAGGDLLVSWSWDGTTRLWDPWGRRELCRFAGLTQHVSRDGFRLAHRAGRKFSIWEVVPSRELRSLPRHQPHERGDYGNGSFSPDGRWLAIGTRMGLRLWDLALEREVDVPQMPAVIDVEFLSGKPALLTSGAAGLFRWPWRHDGGVFRIGPGQELSRAGSLGHISIDQEGRNLTAVDYRGGWALNLEDSSPTARLLRHANATWAATSPDGRYAATGSHHARGVKLWDLQTYEELASSPLIPDHAGARVLFNPNGRWLVTTMPDFRFWRTGTWELVREFRREQGVFNEGIAFSRDCRLMALAMSLSSVHLVEPTTGQVLAELQAPEVGPISWMCFSPDGGHLVVEAWSGDVRIWDLRLIRRQLREIGLDWDQPAYPPLQDVNKAPPQRVERVEFEGFPEGLLPQPYVQRANSFAQRGRWSDAATEYSKALELDPSNHLTWHDAAALYVQTGDREAYRNACREMLARFSDASHPNVAERATKTCCLAPGGLEDYEPAIRLADRAITGREAHGDYKWFVLARGMSDYRAGDLTGAIKWLDKSLSPGAEVVWRDGLAHLFLAMAHHRLNEHDEARRAMDKARAMQQRISPLDSDQIVNWPDCLRFHIVRREAEALLKSVQ
jgi:WD40 repeat protein